VQYKLSDLSYAFSQGFWHKRPSHLIIMEILI